MKSYLDFELSSSEREHTGFSVRVLKAPAGEASGTFELPFSDLEVENILLRIGQRRGITRRIESPEVQTAKDFGERLFRSVFPEEIRKCLRKSLDISMDQDAGLRIRLHLDDVPELADLPWEYLWDPVYKRFLALSSDTPIVRQLDAPERMRPLTVSPPLRILAMFSSPLGVERLDVEKEWDRLRKALENLVQSGVVALDRLEQPTLLDLRRSLRRTEYHIFHFVGHGAFDQRKQDGLLVLEDEYRKPRLVNGEDIATILRDQRTLRLAVLNACEGARTARSDPFAGAAQSLVHGGLPAVIAMQFEISDEAAITFASELYRAVSEGFPLDAALAEARLAIFAQGNGLEWGTPVLYLRTPNGQIFDVTTKNQTPKPLRPELMDTEVPPLHSRQDPASVEPVQEEPIGPVDLIDLGSNVESQDKGPAPYDFQLMQDQFRTFFENFNTKKEDKQPAAYNFQFMEDHVRKIFKDKALLLAISSLVFILLLIMLFDFISRH